LSPTKKPTKPIAVYSRVSDQGDRSDESLRSHEIQRRKVLAYLDSQELTAAPETFEDTDRSGDKMSRPAFDKALAGVRAGKYGGVGVYHLSRFGRNTVGVLSLIAEFEKLGAALVCLTPSIDTSSPEGRAMLTVFLAFFSLEREQSVVKAADTAALKLDEGRTTGGSAPTGYEWEVLGKDSNGKPIHGWLVPSADAPVVTEAFRRFASGSLPTPGRVADFLNGEGVTTSHGSQWNAESVRGLLRREAYRGVRVYGDRKIKDAHEALVPVGVWRQVQRKLRPSTRPARRAAGHPLGGGLVRCGKCGGALSKGLANGKYETLRCNARGAGHASMSYHLAEGWIVPLAFSHGVSFEAYVTGVVEHSNIAELEARVAKAAAAVSEAEALIGATLPPDSIQRRALDDAEADLFDAQASGEAPTVLNRAQYDALETPQEKQEALRTLISRVVIAPGGKAGAKGQDVGSRISVEFTDGTRHPPEWTPEQVPPVALPQ
jgi:DNA invertase Pin-like site-specific DNA recombinase